MSSLALQTVTVHKSGSLLVELKYVLFSEDSPPQESWTDGNMEIKNKSWYEDRSELLGSRDMLH